ncbi:MAG: hypothetical protein WC006_03955 [Bacilli bacterium]
MKNEINVKISIYRDNRIIIENYQKLLDLSEELIKVDIYSIYGDFLKLKQMDNYMIEIIGNINRVVIHE